MNRSYLYLLALLCMAGTINGVRSSKFRQPVTQTTAVAQQGNDLNQKIKHVSTAVEIGNLSRGTLAVVEFYNPKCSICIRFNASGQFEKLADEHADVAFAQSSLAENQALHQAKRVTGFPTFILFKNGKEVDRVVGPNTEQIGAKIRMHQMGESSAKNAQ